MMDSIWWRKSSSTNWEWSWISWRDEICCCWFSSEFRLFMVIGEISVGIVVWLMRERERIRTRRSQRERRQGSRVSCLGFGNLGMFCFVELSTNSESGWASINLKDSRPVPGPSRLHYIWAQLPPPKTYTSSVLCYINIC